MIAWRHGHMTFSSVKSGLVHLFFFFCISQKPPPKVEGIGSDQGKKTQIVVALKDKSEYDSICRAVSFRLRNGGLRAELCTVNKV